MNKKYMAILLAGVFGSNAFASSDASREDNMRSLRIAVIDLVTSGDADDQLARFLSNNTKKQRANLISDIIQSLNNLDVHSRGKKKISDEDFVDFITTFKKTEPNNAGDAIFSYRDKNMMNGMAPCELSIPKEVDFAEFAEALKTMDNGSTVHIEVTREEATDRTKISSILVVLGDKTVTDSTADEKYKRTLTLKITQEMQYR
ncbi:MAG TPA: hypothetical protein DIC42_03855 [Holosporales bacterium]|nr:hypothetical protein [Holosporales bacterium]